MSVIHALTARISHALPAIPRFQDEGSGVDQFDRTIMLYSLINQAPIACARLWDFVDKWMRDFTARLAEKLRLPEDDLQVELSARLAFAITGAASAQWRVNPNNKSPSSAIAKQALRMFEKQKVLIPRKAPRR